jgi:hypothetical protein
MGLIKKTEADWSAAFRVRQQVEALEKRLPLSKRSEYDRNVLAALKARLRVLDGWRYADRPKRLVH